MVFCYDCRSVIDYDKRLFLNEKWLCEKCFAENTKFNNNNIVSPSHYTQGKIECWDYIISLGIFPEFAKANIIKYISRAGKKEGETELKDLQKCKAYLDKLIQVLEEKK